MAWGQGMQVMRCSYFRVILKNTVNLGRKVRNRRLILSDDLFFKEISKNLGRNLVLINMTLRLKVTISLKSLNLTQKFFPNSKILHVLFINYP